MAPTARRVRNELTDGSRVLAQAGVGSPAREARRLLAFASRMSEEVLDPGASVSTETRRRFRLLLSARSRRVPLSLIEGWTGFLDFTVVVVPGVFVPRPETEELAERAIDALRGLPAGPRVLDLGTGTGVLAIALARARSDATVVAVDRSPRALACARRNVQAHGLRDRVSLRRSDWFSDVSGRFHLVVANPPYIARPDVARLEPEVSRYEPRRALDGGPDGLDAVRLLLSRAPSYLLPGGMAFLEIGWNQGAAVLDIARRMPAWVDAVIERDLAGNERFFIGRCG